MISTGLDKKHAIRHSMSQQRRIGTRNSIIVNSTKLFNSLNCFMTQRTNHRITIRNQVLKILGKLTGSVKYAP
jgi:hypothetical protein